MGSAFIDYFDGHAFHYLFSIFAASGVFREIINEDEGFYAKRLLAHKSGLVFTTKKCVKVKSVHVRTKYAIRVLAKTLGFNSTFCLEGNHPGPQTPSGRLEYGKPSNYTTSIKFLANEMLPGANSDSPVLPDGTAPKRTCDSPMQPGLTISYDGKQLSITVVYEIINSDNWDQEDIQCRISSPELKELTRTVFGVTAV
jgi:hypothetical protein